MMKNPVTDQVENLNLPILSSQAQGWENILVEQFQHPPGEGSCHYNNEHTICLSLAPRPVRLLQIRGGRLTQRQVLPVLDYINEHLHQEITLADLAALLGMSQFHFSHQFKLAIGTTPYQYLLQQRVERAKHLLKQTNHSITDIALMCGFNSHSHLSKQFRQLTGMTPRAYRLH